MPRQAIGNEIQDKEGGVLRFKKLRVIIPMPDHHENKKYVVDWEKIICKTYTI